MNNNNNIIHSERVLFAKKKTKTRSISKQMSPRLSADAEKVTIARENAFQYTHTHKRTRIYYFYYKIQNNKRHPSVSCADIDYYYIYIPKKNKIK